MKPRQNIERTIDKTMSAVLDRDASGNKAETPPVTGAGMRMLIYSHDTFGLGHLQRCLKISEALMRHYPELSILLVTGSPLVHRYSLPPGVDYVKLPAVRKVGPQRYEARSLGTSYRRILAIRTNIIKQTVQDYNPHVLLVDHSPTGMKGEMLPALEWLHKSNADCTRILGLRDIIDAPENVTTLWEAEGTYEVLRELYDQILVYGDRSVFDPTVAYRFPPDISAKTQFCNYVSEIHAGRAKLNRAQQSNHRRPLVVVTIGGGDGAGEVVIGSYLDMVKGHLDKLTFDSTIITGPFISDELLHRFQIAARGLPVKLQKFVTSTRPLLSRSDLVISTGGYNTITQVLECARRSIVIPRVLHRKEQLLRAELFAKLGLVTMLHPDDVTPDRLFDEVTTSLNNPVQPLADARRDRRISLDGAERLAEYCGTVFAAKSTAQDTDDE